LYTIRTVLCKRVAQKNKKLPLMDEEEGCWLKSYPSEIIHSRGRLCHTSLYESTAFLFTLRFLTIQHELSVYQLEIDKCDIFCQLTMDISRGTKHELIDSR
jgi:hypothetical protein